MKQVRLGQSNLFVSRIAFGAWELGGDWGATDESGAIATIRHAADSGINFFDTAQGYGFGASERLIARALAGRPRDQLIIATKGGLRPTPEGGVERDASPMWLRRGVDDSLEALGTDYIDLYQVHWPDPKVPFAESAEALAGLVKAGKIRHVGVSNFDAAQMEGFSRTLPVETLQPPYHLFRRDVEASILPYARAHDIGVLVYGPLSHGLLSGSMSAETRFAPGDWRAKSDVFKGELYRRNLRIVDALARFAEVELGTTVSRVAIVGTRNPRHIDDAIAASELKLDASALARIDEIVSAEVAVGGPTPESV